MSSRCTLCCLSSKRKNIFLLFQAMMKQSLALVAEISTIIKVSVTVISLSLDYSGYHKNLIQSLFIICRKKVENKIPLSSMAFQLRHKCSIGYVAMKVNTDKSISTYSIKGWHSCVLKTTISSSKKLTMI